MKIPASPIIALTFALSGCADDTTTFGLYVEYANGMGREGGACELAGNDESEGWTLVDSDSRLPDLWLGVRHDFAEAHTYVVEVVTVGGYHSVEEPSFVDAVDKQSVLQRRYDEQFGSEGREDSFEVEFETTSWSFAVVGLPADASRCGP